MRIGPSSPVETESVGRLLFSQRISLVLANVKFRRLYRVVDFPPTAASAYFKSYRRMDERTSYNCDDEESGALHLREVARTEAASTRLGFSLVVRGRCFRLLTRVKGIAFIAELSRVCGVLPQTYHFKAVDLVARPEVSHATGDAEVCLTSITGRRREEGQSSIVRGRERGGRKRQEGERGGERGRRGRGREWRAITNRTSIQRHS